MRTVVENYYLEIQEFKPAALKKLNSTILQVSSKDIILVHCLHSHPIASCRKNRENVE